MRGGNQNFKVITGLNYRFTGNLHVHVFSLYETGIMTSSKDFTTCRIGTGRCCKKSLLSFFIRIHFFFWELCLSSVCWILIFQPNFIIFLIVLDLLVSFNVLVIKIITSNLADVWHIIFSLIPLTFYRVKGMVLAIKVWSKLKFFAQPMHQIFVIKYCIFLKTSISE